MWLWINPQNCHYKLCHSEITIREPAKFITQEVVWLHTVFSPIISDCKSIFIFSFWANLIYSFYFDRRLNKAFHPQTNSQVARQNIILKNYSWSYINYPMNNRICFLAITEFAYNCAIQNSTGKVLSKTL